MLQKEPSSCPICGSDVGNVKNHVRMSSDGDHGPQGQYPDGFDGSIDSRPQGPPTGPELGVDGSTHLELRLEDDGDDPEDGEDLQVVEFGDDPADASEYECAECGEDLEYHQAPCNCGEQPMWRAPVVES